MSKHILIVIDMQKDFIYGALGNKECQDIVPAVVNKVKTFDGTVIFTKDTHNPDYLNTQEGKNLPVEHCIVNTDGWELIDQLDQIQRQADLQVYEKGTFGSVELAEDIKKQYEQGLIDSIELVGVCTDICVVSNALLLKAMMPELPICADASCCAGVTVEKHEAALETMRSCQIRVF